MTSSGNGNEAWDAETVNFDEDGRLVIVNEALAAELISKLEGQKVLPVAFDPQPMREASCGPRPKPGPPVNVCGTAGAKLDDLEIYPPDTPGSGGS